MADTPSPIVAIVEIRPGPFGVSARIDGQRRFFPNLEAAFAAILNLPERKADDARDHQALR